METRRAGKTAALITVWAGACALSYIFLSFGVMGASGSFCMGIAALIATCAVCLWW